MSLLPHVTVITPCTPDRSEMAQRLNTIIRAQDYRGGMLHLFDYSDKTIGSKLNRMSDVGRDVLLRADSDDLYAPDWISKSVEALLTSGADIVGLSQPYFYDVNTKRTYQRIQKPNSQLYICGATLCYWKRVWERKPFKDTNYGEDTDFISNNGRLYCHGYNEGFAATIHGSNTCSHKAIPMMKLVNLTPPPVQLLEV